MKLSHVSPLCMFEQNCPSWWNGIILALLPGKHFKTCFVQGNVVVVLSYMMARKASISSMSGSPMTAGVSLQQPSFSVASSNIFHACHAVRLHFPRKTNTLSQSVNAYTNITLNACRPREIDTPWINIHLRYLTLPNAIQNLSFSSFSNIEIAKTKTYVSVLITKDVFNSWTAACFTWTNIHLSVSSWLQGRRPDRSILLLQRTFYLCVKQTNLDGCKGQSVLQFWCQHIRRQTIQLLLPQAV